MSLLRNSFPNLNNATRLGGTWMLSPLGGFRP